MIPVPSPKVALPKATAPSIMKAGRKKALAFVYNGIALLQLTYGGIPKLITDNLSIRLIPLVIADSPP